MPDRETIDPNAPEAHDLNHMDNEVEQIMADEEANNEVGSQEQLLESIGQNTGLGRTSENKGSEKSTN